MGQRTLSNIKCTNTVKKQNILYTWVEGLVAPGQMITFDDYENYGGEWTITEVLKEGSYENCLKKFGSEICFLRRIHEG